MSYIILRGHWCHIIVLNIRAQRIKLMMLKDSFHKELECAFEKFPKYYMKILLQDFNNKVGREDIFKQTTGNISLHEINNDNGLRVVHFATSKHLTAKSTMFPHCNIHKYTLTYQDWKATIRLTVFCYTGEGIQEYLMFTHSWQQIVILTAIWSWQKFGTD
jgi:hypothetical protein